MGKAKMKITLDTNVFPADDLIRAAAQGFEFATVSVSAREVAGTSIAVSLHFASTIAETAVFDESSWDECVWAGDEEPLERLLLIIGGGSFPKQGSRNSLTKGQRNQLRDAMVLAAHLREGRDIFVTDDAKGFIFHGRREILEREFATRVMTQSEFRSHLMSPKNEAT